MAGTRSLVGTLSVFAVSMAVVAGCGAGATPFPGPMESSGVPGPTAVAVPTPTPEAMPTDWRCNLAWPPNGYPLAPPGITAVMLNRVTVRLSNTTGRDYFYRISGWEVARLETCLGWVETEEVAGPLEKHSEDEMALSLLGNLPNLRIGIEIRDHPCGEKGCSDPPIGFITVIRSLIEPVEPGSS